MDLQKRTAIAVGLSIVIVIGYSLIIPKPQHIENKDVTNVINEISPAALSLVAQEPTVAKPQPPIVKQIDYKPVMFSLDKVNFEFSRLGANLVKVSFPAYQYDVSSAALLRTEQWSTLEFTPHVYKNSIVFHYKDSQQEITKEYKFKSDYYVELNITYLNLTSSAPDSFIIINSEFTPLPQSLENFKEYFVMGSDGNILRNSTLKIKKGTSQSYNQLKWYGLRDKYFAYIISPVSAISSVNFAKNTDGNDIITLNLAGQSLTANAQINASLLFYCGPQDSTALKLAGFGFEQVRYFGKLDGLAKFLLTSLVFIKDKINSWGMGIIILTIVIFVILYPLTLKQMHSMKKMQVLQPEMDELRKKYKEDPKRLNKEVMELYRKHNANPLGGCLPVILQIPIFFALYQALNRGIELKGAHYLWIKDLSEPDRLFSISGKDINLLPVLMMFTMFFQQKLSMKSMSSMQAEQQKMMLWIMPIMFGVIFYNMPSGLVLYWFTNSILMTLSQWKALK